jgi:site-specific DNA recombinase
VRSLGAEIVREGTLPFGFRLAADGVHLEENPQEQEILARIQESRAAGYTLREIAAELNRQGYFTRKGSAWRHEYVANILKAA